MAAAQPNNQESWALACFLTSELRECLPREYIISYQHWPQECWCKLQWDREGACGETWGEAWWKKRNLAGIATMQRTSQSLWKQYLITTQAHHSNTSTWSCTRETLRCFQYFIGPRTSAPGQQLCQVTAHSLHQGRKIICPKKITGLLPGVWR